ncbi:MAG: hypothetical protein AAFW75_18680 [Cyanobacteria bacterium J06636_16]
MSKIMSKFFQFGYVTNNFERGLEHLKNVYDLPFWEELREVQLEGTEVDGKPDTFTTHIGFAMCGDICVELIYPVGGDVTLYKTEAWREDEFVCFLHHYAADIGNTKAELEAAIACTDKKGARKVVSGSFAGMGDIAFVDTRASIGRHLELITLNAQGRD